MYSPEHKMCKMQESKVLYNGRKCLSHRSRQSPDLPRQTHTAYEAERKRGQLNDCNQYTLMRIRREVIEEKCASVIASSTLFTSRWTRLYVFDRPQDHRILNRDLDTKHRENTREYSNVSI
jgi:hypothetical protein